MYKKPSMEENKNLLEMIRVAPHILEPRSGYRVRKVLEHVAAIIYSDSPLSRNMTPEKFQKNIMRLYKKTSGRTIDYASLYEEMRFPKGIIAETETMEHKTPDCIREMRKEVSYVFNVKMGGYEFGIAGILQGFYTETGKTAYDELSMEERNTILLSVYNRAYGTILLPVYMIQDFIAISEQELYEAGMLLLRDYPLHLYEYQTYYAEDVPKEPCKDYGTIIDYAEKLLDDVNIEYEAPIDAAKIKSQYGDALPSKVLDCYIANHQKDNSIFREVVYLNKYGFNPISKTYHVSVSNNSTGTAVGANADVLSDTETMLTTEKTTTSQKRRDQRMRRTLASNLSDAIPTSLAFSSETKTRTNMKSKDVVPTRKPRRKSKSFNEKPKRASCKNVLPRLQELWENGLDDKTIRNTLAEEGYSISLSTYYRYRNKYRG